jgi:hypothetical protein
MYIKLNKLFVYTIKAAFIGGSVYGSCKGLKKFADELNNDELTTIVLNKDYLKPFENIVNVSLKSGILTSYVLYYGLSCGAVASTAPISVPLIIYFGK